MFDSFKRQLKAGDSLLLNERQANDLFDEFEQELKDICQLVLSGQEKVAEERFYIIARHCGVFCRLHMQMISREFGAGYKNQKVYALRNIAIADNYLGKGYFKRIYCCLKELSEALKAMKSESVVMFEDVVNPDLELYLQKNGLHQHVCQKAAYDDELVSYYF